MGDANIVRGPVGHGGLAISYEEFDDVVANHPVVVIARATDNVWTEPPPGIDAAAEAEFQASLPRGGTGAWVAAMNAPRETVVGGTMSALETVAERAAWLRVPATRLEVDGAFHTPLMAEAVEPFRQALAEVEFRTASVPVVSTVDGQTHVEAAGWEFRLLRQLTTPVRWSQAVEVLAAAGTRCVVDAGSGGRLARLARTVDAGLVTVESKGPLHAGSGRGGVRS